MSKLSKQEVADIVNGLARAREQSRADNEKYGKVATTEQRASNEQTRNAAYEQLINEINND